MSSSQSAPFVKVATLKELPKGKTKMVKIGNLAVALYNVNGKIFATQDACPHEGVSLGCGGDLQGNIIACGYHYWEFNVETGESTDGFDEALLTFPVKIDGNDIYVSVPEGLELDLW